MPRIKKEKVEIMKISELAERSGVKLQTVRYYEGLDLIKEPKRTDSGYRQYTSDYIEQIRFIKNAQEVGLTLREIKKLTKLQRSSKAKGKDVKLVLEAHIEEIDRKMESLKNLKKHLKNLTDSCSGEMSTEECPILKKLKAKKNGG